MKTVINSGAHVGWADEALVQPTCWPAFKNAVLHAIVLGKIFINGTKQLC